MLIDKISLNFNRATKSKTKNHTYQNILIDNVQQLANFIIGNRKDLQLVIPNVPLPINRFHLNNTHIVNITRG